MGQRRGAMDITGVINELTSAQNGAVVFAASTGTQYSLENPAWGNGAFSKAVIEGLNGKADERCTGRITVTMLDLYVAERVKELTKGQQAPTTTKPHSPRPRFSGGAHTVGQGLSPALSSMMRSAPFLWPDG